MIRFGWDTFKKRPWFFVGIAAILFVINTILSTIMEALGESGGAGDLIGFLLNLVVSTLVSMGTVALFLKAHDTPMETQASDLWHPERFLPYLGLTILLGLLIFAAVFPFVLAAIVLTFASITGGAVQPDDMLLIGVLVVAAVVAAITASSYFALAPYAFIDKKCGPIEALKQSVRITKGNRGRVILFFFTMALLNLFGALLLIVGLLVSVPVTLLAFAHLYRTLSGQPSASPVL